MALLNGRKLVINDEYSDLESVLRQYGITKREGEIIQLVSFGKSNNEIEEMLFISLKTVKYHIYNIYRNLNIKNRLELMNLITSLRKENSENRKDI